MSRVKNVPYFCQKLSSLGMLCRLMVSRWHRLRLMLWRNGLYQLACGMSKRFWVWLTFTVVLYVVLQISRVLLLTRKDVEFTWTAECAASFETLKTALTTTPVLQVFDDAKPSELWVDAS